MLKVHLFPSPSLFSQLTNSKLESVLKNLDLALSFSSNSDLQKQKSASKPSISVTRRNSLPPTLHHSAPPADPAQHKSAHALSEPLKNINKAKLNLGSQVVLSWRPKTEVLERNLTLDQRSTLEVLQKQFKTTQEELLEKTMKVVELLIVVEKVMQGFEMAMGEPEWERLGNEERFLVVEGLLERVIGGLAEVLGDGVGNYVSGERDDQVVA